MFIEKNREMEGKTPIFVPYGFVLIEDIFVVVRECAVEGGQLELNVLLTLISL